MPNRLAGETSPYLLQHKDNPVDWLPWGEEAHARARAEDKPLLVSIGYSACHWCHVMERESFEDEAVAAVMNERFVCVKVDREERPDVDALCMDAVQAMTGHGGWPLNMFLTPEHVPFYGGTYFPPQARHGLPSWRHVLDAVAEAWEQRREEIRANASQILPRLAGAAGLRPSVDPIDAAILDAAVEKLREGFDRGYGGWGSPHKFPPHATLEFLLARGELEMSLHTLGAIATGGINDQVGGGFARYAVDRFWTVPHFEKMLYDNALLARSFLHAFQLSGEGLFRRTCEETLEFLARELRAPEGGFYAALDADSEGVEGKFYVWSLGELREVLGPHADAAIEFFGASEAGNFEGTNVLEARGPEPAARDEIRRLLLEARSARVRPGLDDKRIAAWNALAIAAFAEAGAVLERPDLTAIAEQAAEFVLGSMRAPDGGLLRTWSQGEGRIPGFLDDHAHMLDALLTLYEASFDSRWFVEAQALAELLIDRFSDAEHGGFFATAAGSSELPVRRKELEDMPVPAGQSAAALALLRLAALTGEARYEQQAAGVLALLHAIAAEHPGAFGHALRAIDFYLAPTREVALVGEDTSRLERVVRSKLRPHLVLAGRGDDGTVPLLAGRQPLNGEAAAYVCERFACQRPVSDPGELARLLP